MPDSIASRPSTAMKILYKIEGLSPQFDGDDGPKDTITSLTVGIHSMVDLEAVLNGWCWGWGTLSADFVNLRLWIDVLNKLDEFLKFIIVEFGDQMLVTLVNTTAESVEETPRITERDHNCSISLRLARAILRWTWIMLERAVNKDVYNSIEVHLQLTDTSSLRSTTEPLFIQILDLKNCCMTLAGSCMLLLLLLSCRSYHLFYAIRSSHELFNYTQHVNLYLGAFDDQLASSALRVFYALAAEPPNHRTVFLYDHSCRLHRDASLSNFLFDIIVAAGTNRISVEDILTARLLHDIVSDTESKGAYDDPNTAMCSSPNILFHSGAVDEIGDSNNCRHYFRGLKEKQLIETSFPSRSQFYSTSPIRCGASDRCSRSSSSSSSNSSSSRGDTVLGSEDAVPVISLRTTTATATIGNWMGRTYSDVACDRRSVRDILFKDFIRPAIFTSSSSVTRNWKRNGSDKDVTWTDNCLCMLWRLRFIRCEQRDWHQSITAVQGVVSLKMYYQAVQVLMACHPNSAKISAFFQHIGRPILSDLIRVLGSRGAQNTRSSKPTDFTDSRTKGSGGHGVVISPLLPDDFCCVACQCLIAILGRAEDAEQDRDVHRDQSSSRLREMPSFERIQRDLGLGRGNTGGLLVGIVADEMLYLTHTDVVSVIAGTATAATDFEIRTAIDLIGLHYRRLVYIENLISLMMVTLPLPGVLTILIDSGILSLIQAALSIPADAIQTSPKAHLGGERNLLMETLESHCGALLEVRLCVDSFLVQVLDMIIASKERAMLIFYSQGGCGMILRRLRFEVHRPPPLDRLTASSNPHRTSMLFSRQSLIFSLVSITETLLDPNLNFDVTPVEANNNSAVACTLSACNIVISDEFHQAVEEVLELARQGCEPLLAVSLTLLESLIRDDKSPPSNLNHFLKNGLVRAAWLASSKPGIGHEEDTLLSILDFILSLSISDEGLGLVQAINPFPIIFRCFHDHTLLLSETATLVCNVPKLLGKKLSDLLSEYPVLLPSCMRALQQELSHISGSAIVRCAERHLLRESQSSSDASALLHLQHNTDASIDQGDIRVFYFAIAALRCLDEMASQSMNDEEDKNSVLKVFLNPSSSEGTDRGLKTLLCLTQGVLGSNSYLLTSLACRAKIDLGCRHPLTKQNLPGYSPLLRALISVQDKAINHDPTKVFDMGLTEIDIQINDLRALLLNRLGSKVDDPFEGLLSSVSSKAKDLCRYTGSIDHHTAEELNDIQEFCEILRHVAHICHLIFMLSSAVQAHLSCLRCYGDESKGNVADTAFDWLYGSTPYKKEQDRAKKSKKIPPIGKVQQLLNSLIGRGFFLSCVKELVRGQAEGLWDTSLKKGVGEEDVIFNLLVMSSRVSVREGVCVDSKRLSRLEIGCTVDASRRVANEDSKDKMRYCLHENFGSSSSEGEQWVSAAHTTIHPPTGQVDVVSIRRAIGNDCKSPSSSSQCEDSISLRMAGAMACSFFERSTLELLSVVSGQLRVQMSHSTRHSAVFPYDLRKWGVLSRPIARYLPELSFTLVDNLLPSVWNADNRLVDLISFTHAVRLCSHALIKVGTMDQVNELFVLHMFYHGAAAVAEAVEHVDCEGSKKKILPRESERGHLLQKLLTGSKQLFYACLPPLKPDIHANLRDRPSSPSLGTKDKEDEIRCIALRCIGGTRGVMGFWLRILRYISKSVITTTEKALESIGDDGSPYTSSRLKTQLCELLLRAENLPSMWTHKRLAEMPRGVTKPVCELLLEAHKASASCVHHSEILQAAAAATLIQNHPAGIEEGNRLPETLIANTTEIVEVNSSLRIVDLIAVVETESSFSVMHGAGIPDEELPNSFAKAISMMTISPTVVLSTVQAGSKDMKTSKKTRGRARKSVTSTEKTLQQGMLQIIRLCLPANLINQTGTNVWYESRLDVLCEHDEFHRLHSAISWQLQVDTCGLYLTLVEAECNRGRGLRNREADVKGAMSNGKGEEDFWLWPAALIETERLSPRPFFTLHLTKLILSIAVMHISPHIKAAFIIEGKDPSADTGIEDVNYPAALVAENFHGAVTLLSWLVVRCTEFLVVPPTASGLSNSKWKSAMGGLLLSILTILTGGAFPHQVATSQGEGLLLLFTTHSDFKPFYSLLLSAIEVQVMNEISNPFCLTRLGGEKRIEDSWALTGLLLLDFVTRPFLTCKANLLHADRLLLMRQPAFHIISDFLCRMQDARVRAESCSADHDLSFLESTSKCALMDPAYEKDLSAEKERANVVTYNLKSELGPRLLKVALEVLSFLSLLVDLKNVEKSDVYDGQTGAGDHRIFMDEASRACLQLLSRTVHDRHLASVFCTFNGPETILALQHSTPGGILAIVDILLSCVDSPLMLSQRMTAAATDIIDSIVSVCYPFSRGITANVPQLTCLAPAIIREPITAYLAIKNALIKKQITPGHPLKYNRCIMDCCYPPVVANTVYSAIRACPLNHIIDLLFLRVKCTYVDCVKYNRVPGGTEGYQCLLINCLHTLAELLHSLPCKEDSLRLANRCAVVRPKGGSGLSPQDVLIRSSDDFGSLCKEQSDSTTSLVQFLLKAVILTHIPHVSDPKCSISHPSIGTDQLHSSSAGPDHCFEGMEFATACRASAVYFLCSLLASSTIGKDVGKKEIVADTRLASAIYLSLTSAFRTVLDADRELENDSGVTEQLRRLTLLAECSRLMIDQSEWAESCPFVELAPSVLKMIIPLQAGTSYSSSDIRVPLMEMLVEASTYASLHLEDPAALTCLKEIAGPLISLLDLQEELLTEEKAKSNLTPVTRALAFAAAPLSTEKGGLETKQAVAVDETMIHDMKWDDVIRPSLQSISDFNSGGTHEIAFSDVTQQATLSEYGYGGDAIKLDAAIAESFKDIHAPPSASSLINDQAPYLPIAPSIDVECSSDYSALFSTLSQVGEPDSCQSVQADEDNDLNADEDDDGNWSDVDSAAADEGGRENIDVSDRNTAKGYNYKKESRVVKEHTELSSTFNGYVTNESGEESFRCANGTRCNPLRRALSNSDDDSDVGSSLYSYETGEERRPHCDSGSYEKTNFYENSSWQLGEGICWSSSADGAMERIRSWIRGPGMMEERRENRDDEEAQSESDIGEESDGTDDGYDDNSDDNDTFDSCDEELIEGDAEDEYSIFDSDSNSSVGAGRAAPSLVNEEEWNPMASPASRSTMGSNQGCSNDRLKMRKQKVVDWGPAFPLLLYGTRSESLRACVESVFLTEESRRNTLFCDRSLSSRRWGCAGDMGRRALISPFSILLCNYFQYDGPRHPDLQLLRAAGAETDTTSAKHLNFSSPMNPTPMSSENDLIESHLAVDSITCGGIGRKVISAERTLEFLRDDTFDSQQLVVEVDQSEAQGGVGDAEMTAIWDPSEQMLTTLLLALLHIPAFSSDAKKKRNGSCPLPSPRHFSWVFIKQYAILLGRMLPSGSDFSLSMASRETIIAFDALLHRLMALTGVVHSKDPSSFFRGLFSEAPGQSSPLFNASRELLIAEASIEVSDALLLRLLDASARLFEHMDAGHLCSRWMCLALWRREKPAGLVAVTDGGAPSTYLDRLLCLLSYPMLHVDSRITALKCVHRILKATHWNNDCLHMELFPARFNDSLSARYDPSFDVTDSAIKGVLNIAIDDMISERDRQAVSDIVETLAKVQHNGSRMICLLGDIANSLLFDIAGTVRRISYLADSEIKKLSIDFLLHPVPTASGEMKLLRILKLITTATSANISALTSEECQKEESPLHRHHEAIFRAKKQIADSTLWVDLDACMDKIRHLEEKSSTRATSDEDAGESPKRAIRKGPTGPVSVQEMLKKPAYILSPLSNRMVPLLECYFRAVFYDIHPYSSLTQEITIHSNILSSALPEFNIPESPLPPLPLPSILGNLLRVTSLRPQHKLVSLSLQPMPLHGHSIGSISATLPFTSSAYVRRTSSIPSSSFLLRTPAKSIGDSLQYIADGDFDFASIVAASADRLTFFSEKNSALLNVLLRNNIRLLEGSLMPILHLPGCRKILDFEVRRTYLKLRLKRLKRAVHGDKYEDQDEDDVDDDMTIPLEVDRERIIECSYEAFQDLSVRHLVRGKLDISFADEDGVDGGGLTREWYALLMREVHAVLTSLLHDSSFSVPLLNLQYFVMH